MEFICRFFIEGESEEGPVDSGDRLMVLPDVGDQINLAKSADEQIDFVVTRVLDRTEELESGGQRRCDVWVTTANLNTHTPEFYIETTAGCSLGHAIDCLLQAAEILGESGSPRNMRSASSRVNGASGADCLWRDDLREELKRVRRRVAGLGTGGNTPERLRTIVADACRDLAAKLQDLSNENDALPRKPVDST